MYSPFLSDASEHRVQSAPWARPVRQWNPLQDDLTASRGSSYLGLANGKLVHLLDGERPCTALETAVHSQIREHILADGFPCVVARSVLNRATYRIGIYDTLGSVDTASALCHDLYEFSHEFKRADSGGDEDATSFSSFIAVFRHPHIDSELAFEQLLWRQLQVMHGIDARHFEWDGSVSKEPESPDFSFSLGGRAFFVVGLHSRASRMARRAPMACLVFNPHEQFEALRATGKFEKLRDAIRERDLAFQGSLNPMLGNFGEHSESRQYAGRAVPAQWQCPFHPAPRGASNA